MTVGCKRFVSSLAILVACGAWNPFSIKNREVERGNAELKAGKPAEAIKLYDQALSGARPGDLDAPALHFNRGNALFALGKFDDAAQAFLRATEAKATSLKAAAFFNRGNAFFRADKYGEAAESYKRALALDPTDARAKWNLELALRKKKEEDEKKKKDQQNQQGSDGKDGDKNQDKNEEKKDQQSQSDQKNDPTKPEQQKPQEQQGKNEPPQDDPNGNKDPQNQNRTPEQKPAEDGRANPEPRDKDGRDVEAILDNLERSPRSLEQERARLRALRRRPPEKDW